MDILFLYGPTWDQATQWSKHHLARHWSKTHRVYFVESPPNPGSFLTRPRETARRMRHLMRPRQVADRLWVQTFLYPLPYRRIPTFLDNVAVNRFNQRVVRPQLVRGLRRLGVCAPIVVVGGAHALPLLDSVSPSLLAYHCSDDFTQEPTFPKSFGGIERELIHRCDAVICTARELTQAKAIDGVPVHTVQNGVDVAHFARAFAPGTEIPEDVRELPGPIAGYVGSVFQWIDQDMVATAAERLPNWSFVFVGPVQTDIQRLHGFSNIHFLGPRPYEIIPAYLKAFDVATIPFLVHPLTLRANPIKFFEYLATGTPIVSTRLPDLESFGDIVQLVRGSEEYYQGLVRALQADCVEARATRVREAQHHSWDARFEEVDAILRHALRGKSR